MLNQDYTAKVLNLEDVIITNVENILTYFIFIWNYPGKNTVAPPVEP